MTEAVLFLVKAILDLLSVGVLITFFFRLFRVDYYNPIVQGMTKITDLFTSSLRRLFKSPFGIDVASLVIAFFLQAFCFFLISFSGYIAFKASTMLYWSLISVILLALSVLWWALIIGIITSWVSPTNPHPAVRLLQQMTDQICKPFRVFLPAMGGLDFSPILAFLILNFIYRAVVSMSSDAGLPIKLSIGM